MTNIKELLKKLGIEKTGSYKNNFYEIPLEDSGEYAKMYTQLCKTAMNTEDPSLGLSSSKSLDKITNYFEFVDNDLDYTIFLMANFKTDEYKIKISEK